jgi:hypothetical protein
VREGEQTNPKRRASLEQKKERKRMTKEKYKRSWRLDGKSCVSDD